MFLTFVRLGGNVLAYRLEHPAGVDSRTTRAPDLPPWKAPPGRLFREEIKKGSFRRGRSSPRYARNKRGLVFNVKMSKHFISIKCKELA